MKHLLTALTVTAFLFGGLYFIEDRYAHADEFEVYQTEQAQSVQQLGNQLRRDRYEDELYTLEGKDPIQRTQSDNARILRYNRKINELNREMIIQ